MHQQLNYSDWTKFRIGFLRFFTNNSLGSDIYQSLRYKIELNQKKLGVTVCKLCLSKNHPELLSFSLNSGWPLYLGIYHLEKIVKITPYSPLPDVLGHKFST